VLSAVFKDWEPQFFWATLSAIVIPVIVYLTGVRRDRRLFLAGLSKIDCSPYLFYFNLYYDFLAQFAKQGDRPVTSEFTLISFQNMSAHLLSTISSMKASLADAAEHAAAGQLPIIRSRELIKVEELINHLDVLHVVLRTHEVSIIGRAAVFPTEELYDPTKVSDITLDHVKRPVEEIARLLDGYRGQKTNADQLRKHLQEYSSPMDDNIRLQKFGYAALLRWITENPRHPAMGANIRA